MRVTRLDLAPPYESPGHDRMRMLRLQGRESGPSDQLWLGLSYLLPGGGTTLDASSIYQGPYRTATTAPRAGYENVRLLPTLGNHVNLRRLRGGGGSPAKLVSGRQIPC
jgi:hypothetical protein